ncbi:hypothetical protein D623_10021344 [Myotis brandtii]|uniref:Uncharacterized protein n=1 Tax=Myotis brandtii TaxID=109478 RepID=S7NFA9_MYOBR|nr:hypothetical protein D623_10021344 [Myotis brandtii]
MRQARSSRVTYTHQCIRHGAGTRNSSTPGTIVLRLHVTCSKQKRYMYPAEHLSSSATERQRPKRDIETLSVDPGVKVTRSSRSQTDTCILQSIFLPLHRTATSQKGHRNTQCGSWSQGDAEQSQSKNSSQPHEQHT